MSYFIGIDIGGTKTRGVLVEGFKNRILNKFVVFTPKNKKKFLKLLIQETVKLIGKKKIFGIGIGAAGMVDSKKGILIKAHNLPFLNGWNVKKFFKEFKAPVKIDNDSRCFLRAEYAFGAVKNYKNILALTVGTGIGGGIIINGKIFRGRNNSAGEFGHTIIQLQTTNYKHKTLEELGAKEAFLKYGDRNEIIGIGVANLINSFNPDIVVLGGGGIISGKVNLEKVRKTARKYVKSPPVVNTPIVKTKLGDFAQAIGAVLLFNKKIT